VRSSVEGVDSILLSLKNSGILGYSGSFDFTTPDGYKIRLNTGFSANVSTVAYGSRGPYQNSFEVWRASDNLKLLELFFGSVANPAQGVGVAAIWMPGRIDPVNNGGTGMVECVTTGGSVNGTMICTLTGGPWDATGTGVFNTILVKAVASSSAGTISVKALAQRTDQTPFDCAGGNADIYALAFISKTATPHQTTGMWGINDNSIAGTLCLAANGFNYSYYNTGVNAGASDSSQYFVREGSPPMNDSAYPSDAAVDSLLNEMATATDTDMTMAKVRTVSVVDFNNPINAPF
jgi:hypothetical protein